jgi:pimeloyl-ACP methyl ester carboxylesterase
MIVKSRLAVCATVLLASAAPAMAQIDAKGDWHGVLKTPAGDLTLIVTIAVNDDGTLRGELESPDQAPGRKTPLSGIAVTGTKLTFTVASIRASYAGEWVEADGHWLGTFTQGMGFPLTLMRGTAPVKPTVQGLDGVWEGTFSQNGVNLRLALRVATTGRGTIVTLDSPDQAVFGIVVAGFSRNNDSIQFTVPAVGAKYAGRLAEGGGRMSGSWTQPGIPEVAIEFTRTSATAERVARPRPQTPRPPFPYRTEEVTFGNPRASGVTLAGTLTVPEGAGPFPAAVLVSGSGPQDRDETLLGHRPFAVLADYLTRRSIAVLRYDDRGVGKSTGDHASATSADFATDANAAVRYLLTRSDIRRGGVGLIGHSEGGMIAPIAAVDNADVAYIVSLAGPGTNLAQLLQSQRRLIGVSQGASEQDIARTEPVMAEIFADVAASANVEDARSRVRARLTPAVLQGLGAPESRREVIVQQLATEWFRYFLRYDPATVLSRVGVPFLALNGSLDRQVPADENLAAIRAALAGNPNVTIRKIDGLNHLFQTAKTGAIGEYADITETMSPVALDIIAQWIVEGATR